MTEEPESEEQEKMSGCGKASLVVVAIALVCMVGSAFIACIPAYGHMHLKRAMTEYMVANDMRQPKSWEDLEPYRPYFLYDIGGRITQKHYAINWDADYFELCRQGDGGAPVSAMRKGKRRTIIYFRDSPPDPDVEWILPSQLYNAIRAHLDAQENKQVE